MKQPPIAIELFGGAGGLAEGFRREGFSFTTVFDHDRDACASYERNLGHRPVQMDIRDLLQMIGAGWSPGRVDLVVADPPCAPYSKAGKRKGLEDERDMLPATCDVIRALHPTAFLVGNIPGLDEAPGLKALRQTIGALSRDGYCIDFARLDAASFGVPQVRIRPFWFGHARGTPCIRWPEPTHGNPDRSTRPHLPGISPLLPWKTVREALAHLPENELGRPVKLRRRDCRSPQHGSVSGRPARVVGTSNLSDGNVLLLAEPVPDRRRNRASSKPRASRADAPAGVVTTRQNGDGNVLDWPWHRPATTVTTRGSQAPPGHHDESFAVMSLEGAVLLSERAAAILQGFPEEWVFAGKTKKARWNQIGMALPPPLAAVVARAVLRTMDHQQDAPPERPG